MSSEDVMDLDLIGESGAGVNFLAVSGEGVPSDSFSNCLSKTGEFASEDGLVLATGVGLVSDCSVKRSSFTEISVVLAFLLVDCGLGVSNCGVVVFSFLLLTSSKNLDRLLRSSLRGEDGWLPWFSGSSRTDIEAGGISVCLLKGDFNVSFDVTGLDINFDCTGSGDMLVSGICKVLGTEPGAFRFGPLARAFVMCVSWGPATWLSSLVMTAETLLSRCDCEVVILELSPLGGGGPLASRPAKAGLNRAANPLPAEGSLLCIRPGPLVS